MALLKGQLDRNKESYADVPDEILPDQIRSAQVGVSQEYDTRGGEGSPALVQRIKWRNLENVLRQERKDAELLGGPACRTVSACRHQDRGQYDVFAVPHAYG